MRSLLVGQRGGISHGVTTTSDVYQVFFAVAVRTAPELFSEAEVDEIFAQVDANGDHVMDYREFAHVSRVVQSI